MFLLILDNRYLRTPIGLYLHSTMFLLIRFAAVNPSFSRLNLHSTMFLLILGANLIPESFETIYIPLCFYLYDRSVPNVLPSSVFTFHYVSTYTKRTDNRSDKRVDLHSTMFLLIRRDIRPWQSEGIIYIPLCFYLYYSVKVPFLWSGFIYIPLCFYLYGKIDIAFENIKHLHSTMFLLILFTTLSQTCLHIIYIPLCFYLY